MDLEFLAKYGLMPAVKTVKDFIKLDYDRNLSTQKHKQRMTELGEEYNRREQLTEFDYQWKKKMAKYNTDLDRSLAADKDWLHRQRIQLDHDLRTERQNQSFENQKIITKMYNDTSLKRVEGYKEIARINKGIAHLQKYNPDAVAGINQNTWNNLKGNWNELFEQIQQDEMMIQSIRSNPLFQDVGMARIDEQGDYDVTSEEMEWYKAQIKNINDAQERLKEARMAFMMTENELIKFAFDAKITNPVMMDENDMAMFQKIGFPLPAQGAKPRGELGLSEHLKAIELLVVKGEDLPTDKYLTENGFDVEWMNANWPQYRQFYRTRMAQISLDRTLRKLESLGDIGKKLGSFFGSVFF